MACSHETCECQIVGCGLDHPKGWKPKMTRCINGVIVHGEDAADCMAHYLLQAGYPPDRPEHLRKIAEGITAKRPLMSARSVDR